MLFNVSYCFSLFCERNMSAFIGHVTIFVISNIYKLRPSRLSKVNKTP